MSMLKYEKGIIKQVNLERGFHGYYLIEVSGVNKWVYCPYVNLSFLRGESLGVGSEVYNISVTPEPRMKRDYVSSAETAGYAKKEEEKEQKRMKEEQERQELIETIRKKNCYESIAKNLISKDLAKNCVGCFCVVGQREFIFNATGLTVGSSGNFLEDGTINVEWVNQISVSSLDGIYQDDSRYKYMLGRSWDDIRSLEITSLSYDDGKAICSAITNSGQKLTLSGLKINWEGSYISNGEVLERAVSSETPFAPLSAGFKVKAYNPRGDLSSYAAVQDQILELAKKELRSILSGDVKFSILKKTVRRHGPYSPANPSGYTGDDYEGFKSKSSVKYGWGTREEVHVEGSVGGKKIKEYRAIAAEETAQQVAFWILQSVFYGLIEKKIPLLVGHLGKRHRLELYEPIKERFKDITL